MADCTLKGEKAYENETRYKGGKYGMCETAVRKWYNVSHNVPSPSLCREHSDTARI